MRALHVPNEFDGYELVKCLGRGSMGEVHLAKDTLLDRPVAIKFILEDKTDETSRQRFFVEARAIARMQHPNVVSVYRVGIIDGYPYLVSEFIQGQALDTISVPVSATLAQKIAMDIANGLAAAHRRGVIHRDIKPANAILSDDGEVKLLDFGIAKLMEQTGPLPVSETINRRVGPSPAVQISKAEMECSDETCQIPHEQLCVQQETSDSFSSSQLGLTQTDCILGTPQFMAPELWSGDPASFGSDVYSFGALLYTLCAGQPPHISDTVRGLCTKVLTEDPIPLADLVHHIDAALCHIIDKCLNRDPSFRYKNGNDLRSAISKLSLDMGEYTLPAGNPYRGLKVFEAEHRTLFFGRDSEIQMILERLKSENFLLVTGDSGIGKSSLCRAGVIPRVSHWLDKDRDWRAVNLVPGRNPIRSFSASLANLMDQTEEELNDAIWNDPAGIARMLRREQGNDLGLVIFIDQFEEMCTLSDSAESNAAAEFLGWLSTPSPGIRILATARGDFLSRLSMLPQIGEDLPRSLFFLRPLSSERIRQVITGPAEIYGVRFESTQLIDDLVTTTKQDGGGLPLLQFALAELWELRDEDKKTISSDNLNAIGGVAGALSRHADNVIQSMMPREKQAAKQILLQLVTARGTRIRRNDQELEVSSEQNRAALNALVKGRLVVVSDSSSGAIYEIAHEALSNGWKTLEKWLLESMDAKIVAERLRTAVLEWERLHRSQEVLWQSKQLREAKLINVSEISAAEKAFLSASRKALLRSKKRRIALWICIPLSALIVYLGIYIKHRIDQYKLVRIQQSEALAIWERAKTMDRRLSQLRYKALNFFDSSQLDQAETLWKSYMQTAKQTNTTYEKALEQMETALLTDQNRLDTRDLFANLIFESAIVAEKQGNLTRKESLVRRLRLYDTKNIFRHKLNEGGMVSFSITPSEAEIRIFRYTADNYGRLTPKPLDGPISTSKEFSLEQGSYLAIVQCSKYQTIRYPFLVQRADSASYHLELPVEGEVPHGFTYIPAGRFLFGSGADDGLRKDFFHTVPLHFVETDAYLISQKETTFGDWFEFLNSLPKDKKKRFTPNVGKWGFQGALRLEETTDQQWTITFQPTSSSHTAGSGEKIVYDRRKYRKEHNWLNFPVFGISIAEANAYVAWLDESGRVKGARLCSEYEWERGARGSDGREYPHGDYMGKDDANFDDTYDKNPFAMGPDEVESHPISDSPFGLHDMAGNVWEWTKSSIEPDKFAARGGSYYFGANSSRSTNREITEPNFKDVSVGMRVCASVH